MENKINKVLVAWDKNKEINEFIREKLGLKSESGKTHADDIIDNAISRAKYEEKPEWTKLLLEASAPEDKKGNTQINFFGAIAESTNENIDKLVDVTPKKKKSSIEELI
jgi:hypothetical protein